MPRIDTVYNRLETLSDGRGLSASELANDLGLARSNVSSDLNRLCDKGLAAKEGSKPVLYRAVAKRTPHEDSVFERTSRHMPCLFQAGEQAKAAVLYPPKGMPMLLLGETGVGKSRFAKLIYEFAVEMGRIKKSAPFVVFNCADYANNPELLVSHLFGSRKGAFTGADADRPGLLEKADGGILFLDEVHRLPPTGQEMLFSYFDRGLFQRLGETESERRADALIVAATTESPASVLLKTFSRRIPMIIQLPPLSEWSLEERLDLVRGFFSEEAERLGKPIRVSVNVVRALLAYQCPNNIGQLKSDIQLLCAKAYSDLITLRRSAMEIVSANLPHDIKEGLVSETGHRRIWNRLPDMSRRFFSFGAGETLEELVTQDETATESVYELLDIHIRELRARGFGEKAIERELDADIAAYFERCCGFRDYGESPDRIRKLVGDDIDRTVLEMSLLAEERLGRALSQRIRSGLAIHVMNSIKRIRSGRKISNPEFDKIRREHPEEFVAAVECLTIIDRVFEISMPIEEAGFLALFFVLEREKKTILDRPFVVVMAHGESTATSMASACNTLLGIETVLGIDAPLREMPRAAYDRLKASIVERNPRAGVLLLVDMGSLTNFGAELEAELRIRVRTVPLASTLHVIQAARACLMGHGLDRVYAEVLKLDDSAAKDEVPESEWRVEAPMKGYVVCLCTTGEGSADFMKKKLEGVLSADRALVEIVALGMANEDDIRERLQAIERDEGGRIYCLVTPFHTGLGYQEFGVDDLLDKEGLARVKALVDEELLFDKIVESHRGYFATVDSREALDSARTFVKAAEIGFGRELLIGARVGVYCHIAAMIDRSIRGEAHRSFSKPMIDSDESARVLLRKEADRIERRFQIRVCDDEIDCLASFFHPDNCRAPGPGTPPASDE